MSVVVRSVTDETYSVLVKGSPEIIAELCHPDSLPADFHEVLTGLTRQGLRVIAFARKAVDSPDQERDSCECDLEYTGLLYMENFLKPVSASVIKDLNQNDI